MLDMLRGSPIEIVVYFLENFCVCSEARAGNKDVERKLGKVRQVEH